MHEVELFVALLIAVVLIALAARRLQRVPHAVALVVGGVGVGLLPFAPDVHLEPDLIFLAFLPAILYPTAFRFAAEDVRANLRPIGFLAVGLVLATMAAIAAVLHWTIGVPWAAGFAIGAVLAPTDAVAATAVIRSSGAPDRLSTILEGESLVNDGTALTALRIAIAAVGGSFALGSALGEFVLVALGGAAIGAVLGWATSELRRRVDDLELESAIAVLLAYGAFIVAERIGVSGILATVFAGLVMGRRSGEVVSAETRLRGMSFWTVTQFLAESILFLLIGLQFAQILDEPATRGAAELVGLTVLVAATALAVRLAWMFTVPYFSGLLRRGNRALGALISGRERVVIGFAGLRGAVSVAAALSIPATVGGSEFPERGTLLAIALGAIVVLLLVPAIGLPVLLRAVGLAGTGGAAERERAARAALAEAALRRTEELAAEDSPPEDLLMALREPYEWRLAHLRGGDAGTDDEPDGRSQAFRRMRQEVVAAQRRALLELAARGELSGEALRELEFDLDLEEARIG
jgi:CPA1 family monovalent cation:H+ antiporter